MITYTVTTEEAEDILKVLGSLPTQSGAYPLWQKLAEQFKEHLTFCRAQCRQQGARRAGRLLLHLGQHRLAFAGQGQHAAAPVVAPAPTVVVGGAAVPTPVPTATRLYVNLAHAERAVEVAARDVDGVGLLRAEFMLLEALKNTHPLEFVAKGRGDEFVRRMVDRLMVIAGAFHPRPVVYRATDFRSNEFRQLRGGAAHEPVEENPMIGFRGCYRYVQEPSLFRLELQALHDDPNGSGCFGRGHQTARRSQVGADLAPEDRQSPGLLDARMIRPSNCSGIWQPCHPDRSLNVPQTRGKYQVSPSAPKPSGRSCGRRIQVSSGSRPAGAARRSPYTSSRAEGTRIESTLKVKTAGSRTKWNRWAWERLNFCLQLTPNV